MKYSVGKHGSGIFETRPALSQFLEPQHEDISEFQLVHRRCTLVFEASKL